MKNTKKGFTLIELLVVIAIIGILASVVLVNLNSARDKGTDARTKSQLAAVRSQAELLADGGDYDAVCGSATTLGTGMNPLDDAFDGQTLACNTDATTNSTKWAVDVILKDTTTHWCVDSSGFSGAGTAGSGICTAA